jgi:hypothetical protein
MEIGHTLPPAGLGSIWADSPVAGDAALGGDTVLPPEPGQLVTHGVESAGAQTVSRPQPPVTEVHNTDDKLPTAESVDSEFAAPSALLEPAMLIGLQVEAATHWPMPWHGFDPSLPRVSRDSERDTPRPAVANDEQDDDTPTEDTAPDDDSASASRTDTWVDEPLGSAWCEPLTRTLREVLASRVPPQALLAAAEQWQRGRCVVLACPQGDDPAGPAWAFVLWPRTPSRRPARGTAPSLALRGLQVDARLQWSAPPGSGQWCHVRVIKEHHPRTGRQLVSLDDGRAPAARTVPCEVQLGPVLARSLRWCEVCVRIQAAQRFWQALGTQWSVHVVVCAQPLIRPTATAREDSPC